MRTSSQNSQEQHVRPEEVANVILFPTLVQTRKAVRLPENCVQYQIAAQSLLRIPLRAIHDPALLIRP